MKVRLFFRLLSHDITEGIIHNRKFFIFAALLFIFIDFVYWHNISLYFSDYNSVVDCGVLDFFMNVFAGCDPFDPEANKGVDIPITWFSFNVLPYLFVGLYITNDLQTSADTFILRVKSRYLWWLSKIVWCVVSSTLYYLLFFVISTAFTLLSGNFSLTQNSLITEEFLELNTYGKNMTEIFISSVLLPWMITTCHMTFDAIISITFGPVVAFLMIVCLMTTSVFYCSEFLPFNFSMLIRTDFCAINNISIYTELEVAFLIIVICLFLGLPIIKRKNII